MAGILQLRFRSTFYCSYKVQVLISVLQWSVTYSNVELSVERVLTIKCICICLMTSPILPIYCNYGLWFMSSEISKGTIWERKYICIFTTFQETVGSHLKPSLPMLLWKQYTQYISLNNTQTAASTPFLWMLLKED